MLVLSRRTNEEIVIGNEAIVIRVVDIRDGGKVRLGITAPKELSVHRREVYDHIQRTLAEAQRNAAPLRASLDAAKAADGGQAP